MSNFNKFQHKIIFKLQERWTSSLPPITTEAEYIAVKATMEQNQDALIEYGSADFKTDQAFCAQLKSRLQHTEDFLDAIKWYNKHSKAGTPIAKPDFIQEIESVLFRTVPSMTLNSTLCTHAMSTVLPSQELPQPCPTNPPRSPQAVPLRSATSPISMATINDSMTTSLNRFEPLENAKETAPPHLQHAPEAPVQRTTAVVDPREIALHRRQQAATMTTGALQAKAALALIAASIQDPTAPMHEPRQQLVLPLDGQTK